MTELLHRVFQTKFIYNITVLFIMDWLNMVCVYEWTGFAMQKMSVVDDCMATCGTINLDYRSLYHHFENGCFMIDCQSVLDIKIGRIKKPWVNVDDRVEHCTGTQHIYD